MTPLLCRGTDTLVIGCRAIIAVVGFAWLWTGQLAFACIAAVSLALSALPARLVATSSLRDAVRAVTAVLLGAHVALGMGAGLYESSALYDKAVHALGSAAIAVLTIRAVELYDARCGLRLPTDLVACLALFGAVSAGTLWELFEFALDATGAFTTQRGLADTMLDLLADTLGAALAVGVFVLARARSAGRGSAAVLERARPVSSRARIATTAALGQRIDRHG